MIEMYSQKTARKLLALHIINNTPGLASTTPTAVWLFVLLAAAVGVGVLFGGVV